MSDNELETLTPVAQLLTPKPRRYKIVTLPVSGDRVRIQSLYEGEISRFQTETISADGTGLKRQRLEDANRRFIVLCLVDRAGNRILNDTQAPALARWDGADAQYLYEECRAHVGLKKGDIEGLAKNSSETDAAA